MVWDCLWALLPEFYNEMNYAYCWHIDPISGTFFLRPEFRMFLDILPT